MAKKSLPDSELLRKLLRYDPETGKLYWKPRDVEFFKTDWLHRSWNTRRANTEAFTAVNSDGYLCGSVLNIKMKAHPLVWAYCHGEWPEGHIDHINGVRHDNRIENLRVVSNADNCRNQRLAKNNKTGVSGVFWHKSSGKWHAVISVQNKKVFLGGFRDFYDAVKARKAAEKKYDYHPNHGKFILRQ